MDTITNQAIKISDLVSIPKLESGDLLLVAEKNNNLYKTKKINASYINNLRTIAANVGSVNGSDVYQGSNGGDTTQLVLNFRKIIAGDNINVSMSVDEIVISAPTALKLASNTETSAGISSKALSPSGLNSIKSNLNKGEFIVERDYYGNFEANIITATLNGNASSASKLLSAKTIRLTGDVLGSVSTDMSGNVTISTALNGITPPGVPPGTIITFAANSVPAGYLACNGGVYQRTGTYANLFAAIGTKFGTTANTNFCVPDLRGYFVRGYGTNDDNTKSGAFGEIQQDELQKHNHHLGNNSRTSSAGSVSRHGVEMNNTVFGVETYPHYVKNTGGTETRPKNIALNYCIRY